MRANEFLKEDLTGDFLKSRSPSQVKFYSKRDNCGPAAIDMMFWAEEQGTKLNRVQGYFVADQVVYDKDDFTTDMKKEFVGKGLDFNDPSARKAFIEADPKYNTEWREIPHYWLVDKQGEIFDPTGYIQFIRTGLATDLNPSRYLRT